MNNFGQETNENKNRPLWKNLTGIKFWPLFCETISPQMYAAQFNGEKKGAGVITNFN